MDSMTARDAKMFMRLVAIADALSDGHMTIMKFSGNWRVAFHTPADREDVENMAAGLTFYEAAEVAIDRLRDRDGI